MRASSPSHSPTPGARARCAAHRRNRRQTEWHRRLHFCGTAILMGSGFGRLLPLPLLTPLAFEATFFATLLFPLAGVPGNWRSRTPMLAGHRRGETAARRRLH